MALTTNEKLANALESASQQAVNNIVHSPLLRSVDRTLLIKEGFLKPIIRNWYILDADLSTQEAGESALWFDSVWAFIGQYLKEALGDDYCLSPESSIDLLTANNAMPSQVIAYSTKLGRRVELPSQMSLLVIKSQQQPYEVVEHDGVKVASIESALAVAPPSAYRNAPLSMQLAIKLADISELAGAFEHTKNVAAMERLLGAFNEIRSRTEAMQLEQIIKGIGFDVSGKDNPFDKALPDLGSSRNEAAAALRVRALWSEFRNSVQKVFADVPTPYNFSQDDIESAFDRMKAIYVQDAYHSLSIEGYRVTPELIDRVRQGNWSPDENEQDRKAKDALAARGYFEAFEAVKDSLLSVYKGEDLSLSDAVSFGITSWYTALFRPCVVANIISAKDIAGYRKGPVYIRQSQHAPVASEYLTDCMGALTELIGAEDNLAVAAILGHLMLGYIHPFPDGNGRSARFLMNFLFVIGGFDWTIVRVEERTQYLEAMEKASVHRNIEPFAEFIKHSMLNGKR